MDNEIIKDLAEAFRMFKIKDTYFQDFVNACAEAKAHIDDVRVLNGNLSVLVMLESGQSHSFE